MRSCARSNGYHSISTSCWYVPAAGPAGDGGAEGGGFEPPETVKPQRFSRPSQSSALPSLRDRTLPGGDAGLAGGATGRRQCRAPSVPGTGSPVRSYRASARAGSARRRNGSLSTGGPTNGSGTSSRSYGGSEAASSQISNVSPFPIAPSVETRQTGWVGDSSGLFERVREARYHRREATERSAA